MAELTKIEKDFLAEKKKIQDELIEKIKKIEEKTQPWRDEYDKMQVEVDKVVSEMQLIAKKRLEYEAEQNIKGLKAELANVASDVTKLLQKQRS